MCVYVYMYACKQMFGCMHVYPFINLFLHSQTESCSYEIESEGPGHIQSAQLAHLRTHQNIMTWELDARACSWHCAGALCLASILSFRQFITIFPYSSGHARKSGMLQSQHLLWPRYRDCKLLQVLCRTMPFFPHCFLTSFAQDAEKEFGWSLSKGSQGVKCGQLQDIPARSLAGKASTKWEAAFG